MESAPAPPGVANAQFSLGETAMWGFPPLLMLTTLITAGGKLTEPVVFWSRFISRIAPAFDPLDPPTLAVKATSARPLTAFIATAIGVKGKAVPPGVTEGKVTRAVTQGVVPGGAQWVPLRSTTASLGVGLALLATRATLRRLSTATETGADATQLPASVPREPVQSDAVETLSDGLVGVPKFMTVMSFEP